MLVTRPLWIAVWFGLICLSGCDRTATEIPQAATPVDIAKPEFSHSYQNLYHAITKQGLLSLQNSQRSAQELATSVNAFLANSDQENWQQLQQQWRTSHQQWHHSDSYLQLLSPSHELNTLRLKIHSQEVTPGYLDYIEGYPESGIVNDSTLALSQQTINDQHRRYSTEETALGIHVLEFFIWERKLEDYSEQQRINQQQVLLGLKQQQLPTPRRRQYLTLLAQQWLSDIDTALSYWQQHADSPLPPTALKLSMQQMLGNLSDAQHCQFSADTLWINAVVSALSPLLENNDDFLRLQKMLSSNDSDPSLKQNLGAAMLSLTLKAD